MKENASAIQPDEKKKSVRRCPKKLGRVPRRDFAEQEPWDLLNAWRLSFMAYAHPELKVLPLDALGDLRRAYEDTHELFTRAKRWK